MFWRSSQTEWFGEDMKLVDAEDREGRWRRSINGGNQKHMSQSLFNDDSQSNEHFVT